MNEIECHFVKCKTLLDDWKDENKKVLEYRWALYDQKEKELNLQYRCLSSNPYMHQQYEFVPYGNRTIYFYETEQIKTILSNPDEFCDEEISRPVIEFLNETTYEYTIYDGENSSKKEMVLLNQVNDICSDICEISEIPPDLIQRAILNDVHYTAYSPYKQDLDVTKLEKQIESVDIISNLQELSIPISSLQNSKPENTKTINQMMLESSKEEKRLDLQTLSSLHFYKEKRKIMKDKISKRLLSYSDLRSDIRILSLWNTIGRIKSFILMQYDNLKSKGFYTPLSICRYADDQRFQRENQHLPIPNRQCHLSQSYLIDRHRKKCDCCQKIKLIQHFERGHLVPKKHDGSFHYHNIIMICHECNLKMGHMDPHLHESFRPNRHFYDLYKYPIAIKT